MSVTTTIVERTSEMTDRALASFREEPQSGGCKDEPA